MSSRSFFSEAELHSAQISRGTWFSLCRIDTASGTREILHRKNGNLRACKVLPLVVSKKLARSFSVRGKCSFKRFRRELSARKILKRADIALLACDRPCTYFPGLNFSQNWLYELPGGVVEKGEKVSAAGIREALEELGIHAEQVVAYCDISSEMPYDSGSHAEFVSVVAALCYGEIAPIAREGIIPEQCTTVPFRSLRRFVKDARRKHMPVEGHILSAAAQLVF